MKLNRFSDEKHTAVIADNHVKIFIEIKFEKCVTHKIFYANSKNSTSIFM